MNNDDSVRKLLANDSEQLVQVVPKVLKRCRRTELVFVAGHADVVSASHQ